MNNKNYRKYYEAQTGVKIPDGFHIHHIDHDRDNNTIENLVALPEELHTKYHNLRKKYSLLIEYNLLDIPNTSNKAKTLVHYTRMNNSINDFIKCLDHICYWMEVRESLCGGFWILPDVYSKKSYEEAINSYELWRDK